MKVKERNNERFFIDHIYVLKMEIFRIAMGVFGDPEVSEELTQNVFEKAWKGLDSLRDESKLRAWINAIIGNEIKAYLRKKQKEKSTVFESEIIELINDENLKSYEQDILEFLIAKEEQELVWDTLSVLNKNQQEIIKLHLIGDISLKDIADLKGLTYSNTRMLYSRGLSKLRELCVDLEGGARKNG